MSLVGRNFTPNQGTVDRDLSEIFVWDNKYENVVFLNNTGAEANLIGGEILGRVAATQKVVLLDTTCAICAFVI